MAPGGTGFDLRSWIRNLSGVTEGGGWGGGREARSFSLLAATPPQTVKSRPVALGGLWVGPKFPICSHTDPPSVSAINAVVLAAVGEEAVLVCEVSGVPPPRVVWYRGTRGVCGTVPRGPRRISFPEQSGGHPLPPPSPASSWLSGQQQDLE